MMFRSFRIIRPLTIYTSQATPINPCTAVLNTFKTYSTGTGDEISVSGLAKALGKFREFEKSEKLDLDNAAKNPTAEQKSFLHLLRNSEFVQMGDPVGKIVIGKIFQVVNTDLYIDFGGKFYCVCRKPKRSSELYVRNAKVKVRINELELCARFLGAVEDLTLTEASGTLLDLVWTPVSSKKVVGKEATAEA